MSKDKLIVVTCGKLKEWFPKYAKFIDEHAGQAACGCSMCVLTWLKQAYPEEDFRVPDGYEYAAYV